MRTEREIVLDAHARLTEAEAKMRANAALVTLQHCQDLGLDDDDCVTAAKLALRAE